MRWPDFIRKPFMSFVKRMIEKSMKDLENAIPQLAKLDRIREHLRSNRDIVWSTIRSLPGIGFRTLPDRDGDLATHLIVIFPDATMARNVSQALESITLDQSGWHVYSHMENLLDQRTVSGRGCPFDCAFTHDTSVDYRVGMLPRTDALLARSMSFAIGVMDPNLAPFGLRMRDDAEVARQRAQRFVDIYHRHA
jgi:8-amino-3,8-dideoxy-alpha-D-manno-octulosonate transaminase